MNSCSVYAVLPRDSPAFVCCCIACSSRDRTFVLTPCITVAMSHHVTACQGKFTRL